MIALSIAAAICYILAALFGLVAYFSALYGNPALWLHIGSGIGFLLVGLFATGLRAGLQEIADVLRIRKDSAQKRTPHG